MIRDPLPLSPSSAGDFKNCPQLFKFRAIDRLPEPASSAATRGSLVHSVLERLFVEAPQARTPERAEALLEALWRQVRDDPEVRPPDMDGGEEKALLAEGRRLLRNYFQLEDPRSLSASRLEWWVSCEMPNLHLRGVIDRLEEYPDGSWILTDYKTGRIPGESRELQAFFGLRFYALVCWRAHGIIPREMRLVYLSDPAVLSLNPHEQMLLAFEKQLNALGGAVRRAIELDDWRPRPSPLCLYCAFQSQCPAWTAPAAETGPGQSSAAN